MANIKIFWKKNSNMLSLESIKTLAIGLANIPFLKILKL